MSFFPDLAVVAIVVFLSTILTDGLPGRYGLDPDPNDAWKPSQSGPMHRDTYAERAQYSALYYNPKDETHGLPSRGSNRDQDSTHSDSKPTLYPDLSWLNDSIDDSNVQAYQFDQNPFQPLEPSAPPYPSPPLSPQHQPAPSFETSVEDMQWSPHVLSPRPGLNPREHARLTRIGRVKAPRWIGANGEGSLDEPRQQSNSAAFLSSPGSAMDVEENSSYIDGYNYGVSLPQMPNERDDNDGQMPSTVSQDTNPAEGSGSSGPKSKDRRKSAVKWLKKHLTPKNLRHSRQSDNPKREN